MTMPLNGVFKESVAIGSEECNYFKLHIDGEHAHRKMIHKGFIALVSKFMENENSRDAEVELVVVSKI